MNSKEKPEMDPGLLLTGLTQIVSDADDYIFIKDKNFVYYAASLAFLRLVGLKSNEEIVGKTDYDLFTKDIADKYRRDDVSVFLSNEPISDMIERIPSGPDGKERWSKTSKKIIRDAEGKVIGIYGWSRDVSDVVTLENAAQEGKKFNDIVSKMPCGLGILHRVNREFILDYANDGWCQLHYMSEKDKDSLIGKSVSNLIYPDDQHLVLDEYNRVEADDKAIGDTTYRMMAADGKMHWIQILFRFAYSENGVRYYYTTYLNLDAKKKIEEEMIESRDTLQEAINGSNIQYFTYYPDQHRCVINSINKRYSGVPSSWDNFPSSFISYVRLSEADADAYLDMIRKIDCGAKEASCTVRMFFKGAYYWEAVHLNANDDAKGDKRKALGYTTDISFRVSSEEKIRKERVRLKTLEGGVFEAFSFNLTKNSAPDIQTSDTEMLTLDLPKELLEEALTVSPGLASSNPATREILLRAANRIPDKEEREKFIGTCAGSQLRKALSQGINSLEIRYRRIVKGQLKWVISTSEILPDPDSGDLFAFYYTKDINDEVINEEITSKIVGRNYESASVLDLTSDTFLFRLGSDPAIKSLDKMKYEEALAAACKHVAPESLSEFSEKLKKDNIIAGLEKESVYTVYNARNEIVERLPNHPKREMKNDIFYLDEHKDTLVFLLSDVTEIFERESENREKLRAALNAAEQASVAKTEFLSRMSHEIRTPMNAIIGLDAIALQEKNLSSSMEDHLQKIGISAHFLLSLINDILDMSRIESGRMVLKNDPFNFEELINGINTILYQQCKDSGLDYECVVKTYTEPSYVGDMTKLQQVLVNILGNAVKFTPRGGKIHFMISQTSRSKNKVGLRFEISDTGIGIDEKFIPHLFEPFSQENRGRTSIYGGTGLGLAISKNIVNLMGGSISVHSIKNVGSDFTVNVQLGLTEDAINKKRWYNPKLTSLYTLIVDDDIIVCQHTQIVLNEAGFKAEYVDSGADAIVKVTENHQSHADYDLILLDWKMPDMDGVETAREIRKIVGPDVTIIVMTAYDWADIESEALAAGVDYFMRKPIFASSVQTAFENVFNRKKKENGAPSVEEEPEAFDFTGKRILLAEDNEINAEIAKTLLENKHCQVEVAKNGAEAVESFASAPSGYYNLILMDVRMPVMDGLEATKTIRAMRKPGSKSVPIVAMTANAFQEDVNQSLEAGMNAHLAKPIEPVLLYSTIAKLLG